MDYLEKLFLMFKKTKKNNVTKVEKKGSVSYILHQFYEWIESTAKAGKNRVLQCNIFIY